MSTQQVDRILGLTGDFGLKAPCRVATTGAVTLSGLQTIDSATLVDGDRVLVKAQADPTQNGIYLAHSDAWERAFDFDGPRDCIDGTAIYVRQGSQIGLWRVSCSDATIIVGTSSILFVGLIVIPAPGSLGVDVRTFGATGLGIVDDGPSITAAINSLSAAGGGTLLFPSGTYLDSSARNLPPKVSLVGAGIGATKITHTGSAAVRFNMPALVNDSVIDYGGNIVRGITFTGTGTGSTDVAFKIKNKVNISFQDCEIDNYQYLIEGVRDAAGNSVNGFSAKGVRFGRCKTAIYAPMAWNGMLIDRACTFSQFEDWAVIVYDTDGITIDGTFNSNPATSGAGHVFLGGCSGFAVSSYFEGNPNADHFLNLTSAKDRAGSATNNAIAIGTSRGGIVAGARWSSGAGTAYGMKLDGVQSVLSSGCRAGSGISTALARVTTGTRGNTFIACYPASGTVASFQTIADGGFNVVEDFSTGQVLMRALNCTVSTLPDVTAPGQIVYVANEAGGQTLAVSNGTNWLRMQDRATVS